MLFRFLNMADYDEWFGSSDSDFDEEFYNQRRRPQQRKFRTRTCFLDSLNDYEFLRRFRLNKYSFRLLLEKIKDEISPQTNRSHAISAEVKIYATLRFFATGTFFLAMGEIVGLSESSMCRIVPEVSKAIAKLKNETIYFPRNNTEKNEAYEKFYDIAGFSNVIGTIDCTHVKISGQGKTVIY